MSRTPGAKNIRSYLASNEIDRLGINLIEEAHKCIKELDELKQMNMEAYARMRGYGEKHDAGTSYLANAGRDIADKAVIIQNLSRFVYPTLTAIGVKDLDKGAGKKPMTTIDAVNTLKADPFAPPELKEVPTDKIIDAMNCKINAPLLPIGSVD
jgi:hypothetical protein